MTGPRSSARRLGPAGGTFWLDVVVGVCAALAALIAHITSNLATLDPRLLPPSLLSCAAVIAALSLVLRRTRPIVGFVILATATSVVSLTDHYVAVLPLLLLISLYSVTAHSSRLAGVVTLVSSILIFMALALIGVPDLRLSAVVQSSALLIAAWAVGLAVRSGRIGAMERLRAAEQNARAAREEAARATAEERLRIARELHDVVAHSMSMIAVQAGVGAHVIKTDPLAAEHALAVIAETSREALTQTRRCSAGSAATTTTRCSGPCRSWKMSTNWSTGSVSSACRWISTVRSRCRSTTRPAGRRTGWSRSP
jgi:signal transduction histidine kinase